MLLGFHVSADPIQHGTGGALDLSKGVCHRWSLNSGAIYDPCTRFFYTVVILGSYKCLHGSDDRSVLVLT